MATLDNQKLKQIFLLSLIIGISYLLFRNLTSYLSAFLGALTLYILFRNLYRKLVEVKGWKDWICAMLIMTLATVAVLGPFSLLGYILTEKITKIVQNPDPLINQWNILVLKIKELTGYDIMSGEVFEQIQGPLSTFVPNMLGSTLMIVVNFAIMYFILYFMFINGREMEAFFKDLFPMQKKNTKIVGDKAREMIISNTIVIPLLAVIQGIVAFIGYIIFGVNEAIIMAVLTAIASVIPMVGTMLIWVPLSLILLAQGHIGQGIGLLLYGGILVTNIDNVIRFMLQKKIADVHPMITVFGVIVGVNMFGFVGLIFGPTLISLLLLLIDLYIKEFTSNNVTILDGDQKHIIPRNDDDIFNEQN